MPLFFKSLIFVNVSWTFICIKLAPVTAIPTGARTIRRCPFNESEWQERADRMFCHGSDSYHCLLAEDGVSVKESCIEKALILKEYCPIFTDDGYLQWVTCNGTECPKSPYISDEVHQYRICFGNTDKLTEDGLDHGEEDSNNLAAIIIPVGIVILLVVIVVSVVIWRCIKRKEHDKDVHNGHEVLRKKNILYIVGQLGNSVSTVGKQIASSYHEKPSSSLKCHSKSSWDFKCLNYLEVSPNFEFSDNTVYFIDGWFGLWNDNPCETALVEKNLKLILTRSRENKKTKFVLGIQTNVKELYADVFKRVGISFSQANTILRDSSSTWKKRSIESHLRKIKQNCPDSNCQCRKLKVDDILSVETLGTHLVLKLLNLDHALADKMLHRKEGPAKAMTEHFQSLEMNDESTTMLNRNKGPVKAMTKHFKSLQEDDEGLFKGILYIVLKGVYDDGEFDSKIAKEFSITKENLTNKNLEKYTKKIDLNNSQQQKSKLSPMWIEVISDAAIERKSAQVFWHNFLYICAFRACYLLYPDRVMQYCNLDAILQLVRPKKESKDNESGYTVETSLELITKLFNGRIKGKVFEDDVKDHPLMQYLRAKA